MSLLSRLGAAYDALATSEAPTTLQLKALRDETTFAAPAPWLRAFGGHRSASGKSVTPDSALATSVGYGCVSVLARSVAQVSRVLMKRTSDGAIPAVDHPLYWLLLNLPNPEMTAQDATEMGMNHLLLRGNAYDQVVRSAGDVVEVNPLHPDYVRMYRAETSGELRYEYNAPWGERRDWPASQIWRRIGMSFNGIQGVSVLTYAREAMGLSLAVEEHGARLFANGAQVATALETPEKLSQQAYDRLKSSFENTYGGSRNAWKSVILEEGLKVSKLAMTSVDSQFLESRKFQVEEICRFFGVPPHKVQDLSRATFNNIEHLSADFVTSSLLPWFIRYEQSIFRDLLLPNERKKYFVRHEVDQLLPVDRQARANYYASGIANTWLSPNEVRAREGMNKREGGDKFANPNTSTGKEEPGQAIPNPTRG